MLFQVTVPLQCKKNLPIVYTFQWYVSIRVSRRQTTPLNKCSKSTIGKAEWILIQFELGTQFLLRTWRHSAQSLITQFRSSKWYGQAVYCLYCTYMHYSAYISLRELLWPQNGGARSGVRARSSLVQCRNTSTVSIVSCLLRCANMHI